MNKDIIFVETLFRKLIENNIKFCILRNADEILNGDAHDIDMTVDIIKIYEVVDILNQTADLLGWRVHFKTGYLNDKNNIKSYHFYTIVDNEPILLHFDIFPTFTWNGMVLLSNKDLIKNIGKETIYHVSNPGIESVTKLFIRLLHNGYIKDKYKDYIQNTFKSNEELVKTTMRKFLSDNMADKVYDQVMNVLWSELEKDRKKIIVDIKKTLRRKEKYNSAKINYKRYLFRKIMKKTGLMVVFEGTDGSGKTTIINGLPSILGRTFNEDMLKYYHWRPRFIKSPKKKSNKNNEEVCTEPHKEKPYGKFVSLGKFLFFNLDYIFGYWFKVRIQLIKGRLVVFDRYYYDYYLDKIRYRLNISDGLLDFCKILIPKPDVTFLLVGDAEVLYSRKKEIPIEEIQKQIDRLIKQKKKFHNSVIIDVNNDIDTVINEVSKSILSNCNNKYRGEV